MKVMEFLCSFVVLCLSKEQILLRNKINAGMIKVNKGIQCLLPVTGSDMPSDLQPDQHNEIQESIL